MPPAPSPKQARILDRVHLSILSLTCTAATGYHGTVRLGGAMYGRVVPTVGNERGGYLSWHKGTFGSSLGVFLRGLSDAACCARHHGRGTACRRRVDRNMTWGWVRP